RYRHRHPAPAPGDLGATAAFLRLCGRYAKIGNRDGAYAKIGNRDGAYAKIGNLGRAIGTPTTYPVTP
ncbi:MAG: hypothetical protein WCA82_12825, partial [Jiangellales bacterium]